MNIAFHPADLDELPGTLRATLEGDNTHPTWGDIRDFLRVFASRADVAGTARYAATERVIGAIDDALLLVPPEPEAVTVCQMELFA